MSQQDSNTALYIFSKGTVDVTANRNAWSDDDPFLLAFHSEDHNGWGITKSISATEAKDMTKDKALAFYIKSLDLLGIANEVAA